MSETHLVDYFLRGEADSRQIAEQHLGALATRGIVEGSILEIGCEVGTLLDAAEERGFGTAGIELNRGSAEYAGRRHDVTQIDFLEAKVRAQFFDAIVMDQTLEHLGRPLRALELAAKALRPGGSLVLGVPRYDWLRLALDDTRALFKLPRTLWSPEDHLNYFTPGCLVRHLRSVGLSAEQTRTGSLRSHLSSMLRASSGVFLATKPV